MRMVAISLCLIMAIAICALCHYGYWHNKVVSKEFEVGYASGIGKTNGVGCHGDAIMEEIEKFKSKDLTVELVRYLARKNVTGYTAEEICKANICLDYREDSVPRCGFGVSVESNDFGLTGFVALEFGNFVIDYVDSYRKRGRDKAVAMISSRLFRLLKSAEIERELTIGMKELHKEYALALKAFESRSETIFEISENGSYSDFASRASIRFWIKGDLRARWAHEMMGEVKGPFFVDMLICACREISEEFANMSDEDLLDIVKRLECSVDEDASELCIYADGADLGESLDLLVACQYVILVRAVEKQKDKATYQRIYVDTVDVCRYRCPESALKD